MNCHEAQNTDVSIGCGAAQLLSELPSVCGKTGKDIIGVELLTVK